MKKYRFTILKHIKRNGSFYFVCKVKTVYSLVWTMEGIRLYLFGNEEKYLNVYGGSYWDDETRWDSREELLKSIDLFMKNKEEEDGKEVVSVETEIIWR